MKRAIKFVLWTILGLVALVVLLVATLPLWFGPVARPIANLVVPRYTQTDFRIGRLSLNPYSGRLEVGDVRLGNPKGYAEPQAVAIGSLVVEVDPSTVLSDCVHVREVTLSDCFVSYLTGGENGIDNLTQIRMNAVGDKDDLEAEQRQEDVSMPMAEGTEMPSDAELTPEEMAADADEEPSRRLVISRLSISGVRVKLQMITIPVPPITLTGVGEKSNGVTLTELSMQIWDAILKGASSVGDGAVVLGGLINAKAGELGDTIKAIDYRGAGKATGDSLKSAADSLQSAAGTVNEGVKKTADSVKRLLGL